VVHTVRQSNEKVHTVRQCLRWCTQFYEVLRKCTQFDKVYGAGAHSSIGVICVHSLTVSKVVHTVQQVLGCIRWCKQIAKVLRKCTQFNKVYEAGAHSSPKY